MTGVGGTMTYFFKRIFFLFKYGNQEYIKLTLLPLLAVLKVKLGGEKNQRKKGCKRPTRIERTQIIIQTDFVIFYSVSKV